MADGSAKKIRDRRTAKAKARAEANDSAKRWFVLVASVLALYETQEDLHCPHTWETFEKEFGPFPLEVIRRLTSSKHDDEALFWDVPVESNGRPWMKVPAGARGPWLTYKGRLFAKALVGCTPFMGAEVPKPGTREWDRAALYVARHQ